MTNGGLRREERGDNWTRPVYSLQAYLIGMDGIMKDIITALFMAMAFGCIGCHAACPIQKSSDKPVDSSRLATNNVESLPPRIATSQPASTMPDVGAQVGLSPQLNPTPAKQGVTEPLESSGVEIDEPPYVMPEFQVLKINVPNSILKQMEPTLSPDNGILPIQICYRLLPPQGKENWRISYASAMTLYIGDIGWAWKVDIKNIHNLPENDRVVGAVKILAKSGDTFSIPFGVNVVRPPDGDWKSGNKYHGEIQWYPVQREGKSKVPHPFDLPR